MSLGDEKSSENAVIDDVILEKEVDDVCEHPFPTEEEVLSTKEADEGAAPSTSQPHDATISTACDTKNPVKIVTDEVIESVRKETRSPAAESQRLGELVVLRRAAEKLHSPFYWQADLSIRSYGNHNIDLLTDLDEMFRETSFTFRRFIIHLIRCYHNFFKRLMDDSKKNLEAMERMLSYSSRKESNDVLFNSIKDALLHVSHSCRVYILEKTNQMEKAEQILKKIKSYESMNDSNKAGVWGIRAAVYVEYGYEGVKKAIEYASKAIELDNTNAYWYFFKGVYLGRLRRMEKGPVVPKEEEIKCLESARKKYEDPAFYAFIAEVYVDTCKATENLLKRNKIPTSDGIKEKLSQHLEICKSIAVEYFEKSVEMRSNCAHLLFRCGKGLMRLSPPYNDPKKAEEYLENGLKLSPNSSFGNHAMATFMMKYKKNNEVAKEYLAKSVERGNFQAHMDLSRISYLEDKNTEILISSLYEMLKLYEETPKKCKILGELIIYHLFLRYNLEEACKCATYLIELQSESQASWIDYIYEFNSGLFPFSHNVPLVELLLSEVGNQLHRADITEPEKNIYKKFLHFIIAQQLCSRLPVSPKNIWEIYAQDLKRGWEKQANFVKSCSNEEKCSSKEKNQVVHLRSSSDNEYRKYYTSHEKKTVCNVLHPLTSDDSDNEKRERGQSVILRRNQKSPRQEPSRPHRIEDNSESSSKRLTENFAALATNEKNNSDKETKSNVSTSEMRVAEKVILAKHEKMNRDISYRTEKRFPGNSSKERLQKSNKNDSSSDGSERKSVRPRENKVVDEDSDTDGKSALSRKNKEKSPTDYSDVERKSVVSSGRRKYYDSSCSFRRDSGRSNRNREEYRRSPDEKYRDRYSSRDKSKRFERNKNEDGYHSSSSRQSAREYPRRQRRERSYSPSSPSQNRKYKSKQPYASGTDSSESEYVSEHRACYRNYNRSGSDDEFRREYVRRQRQKRSYSPRSPSQNRKYKSKQSCESGSDGSESEYVSEHRARYRNYNRSGSDDEFRYSRKHQELTRRDSREKS